MIRLLILLLIIGQISLWAVPFEIDLSGGTGGNDGQNPPTYTAPNGTQVTSSAGAYPTSAYGLRHMFDNTFGNNPSDYWLPNTHSTTTLQMNLDKTYYLTQIRVLVYTQYSHHATKYQLETSTDGSTFTDISGGYLNAGTSSDIYWNINGNVSTVRLHVQTTTTWMCINEIELYSDTSVPEPTTIALALMGIFAFIAKKKISQ